MSAYRGPAGGPRDPATPGGYCLRVCYCGGCPQFVPLPASEPVPAGPLAARATRAQARAYTARTAALTPAPEGSVDWSEPDRPGVLIARDARPTSRAAAAAALPRSGTQRRRVFDAILTAHWASKTGATDPELQRHLELPANTERPRRVELVTAGLVVDSGLTRAHDGRAHVVWAPAPHLTSAEPGPRIESEAGPGSHSTTREGHDLGTTRKDASGSYRWE